MIETAQTFIERKRLKCLGKVFKTKDISRNGKHLWKIEAITFFQQSTYLEKIFTIERIVYTGKEGEILLVHDMGYQEYRIGYYIVGKNGNKTNKWTWGQFCPFIPTEDLPKLIEKAKNEGTIL